MKGDAPSSLRNQRRGARRCLAPQVRAELARTVEALRAQLGEGEAKGSHGADEGTEVRFLIQDEG